MCFVQKVDPADFPEMEADRVDTMLVTSTYHSYCDDTSQTGLGTLQVTKAAIRKHHERFPHITECIDWADNGNHYTGEGAYMHAFSSATFVCRYGRYRTNINTSYIERRYRGFSARSISGASILGQCIAHE
jgi:hypothetical protein